MIGVEGSGAIAAINRPQTRSNSGTTKPQDERRRENNLLTGQECENAENVTDTDNVEDAG